MIFSVLSFHLKNMAFPMKLKTFICLFLLCFTVPAMGLAIAGVTVPETLNTDLKLNGGRNPLQVFL